MFPCLVRMLTLPSRPGWLLLGSNHLAMAGRVSVVVGLRPRSWLLGTWRAFVPMGTGLPMPTYAILPSPPQLGLVLWLLSRMWSSKAASPLRSERRRAVGANQSEGCQFWAHLGLIPTTNNLS